MEVQATVPILVGVYLFCIVVVLVTAPSPREWLPESCQSGGHYYWVTPMAWILCILLAPFVLAFLCVASVAELLFGLARRCCSNARCCSQCAARRKQKEEIAQAQREARRNEKRAKKANEDFLEAGCNFEDSILSASDMPPMYEDCQFSVTSSKSSSPRSSLY